MKSSSPVKLYGLIMAYYLFSLFFILQAFPLLSSTVLSQVSGGLSVHYISANGSWQISFPAGSTSDGLPVTGLSRLEYEQLSNFSLSCDLSFVLFNLVQLKFLFFPSWFNLGSLQGSGTDQDLYRAPGCWDYIFSLSDFKNRNSPSSFQVQARLKLLTIRIKKAYFTLNALAGYLWNREDITMTDGIQCISGDTGDTNITLPPVGSRFASLHSTYQFNWNSLMLGCGVSTRLIRCLSLEISPALLYNFYYGQGFWNLRTYASHPSEYSWQNESPNFIHESAQGFGFSLGACFILNVGSYGQWKAGYALTYLAASQGKEELYFYHVQYNSTASDVKVGPVEFIQHDFDIGFSLKI